MGQLRMRRIYEAAEEDDGYRILVDRLWPRGISKEKAKLDLWAKEIAPSRELRSWYGHDPEKFSEFSERYKAELEVNPGTTAFCREIAEKLSDGNVTLLYGAKDGSISNAAVLLEHLKNWITGRQGRTSGNNLFSGNRGRIS